MADQTILSQAGNSCAAAKGKKKKSNMMTKKRGERIFLFCLLFIPITQVLVFYVGVNINSILLAFQQYDFTTAQYTFQGFANFGNFLRDLVQDPMLLGSSVNSVIMYLVGLLINMPLCVLISYCIFKKIPMNSVFRTIIFLPSIIPGMVFVLIYKQMAEMVIPTLLTNLGIPTKSFLTSEVMAFPAMLIYGLWTGFGVGIILYTNAMTRIPESLIEFGKLEGLGAGSELWRVVIPMIFPTITTFLVTGVAGIFTNSGPVYAFYADSAQAHVYNFGYYFFTRVIGKNSHPSLYPYAASAGLIFTLVAAPITLLVKYLLEKFGPSAEY